MALFDVGSLPPWMIQRESPTDALAKGIQAGSQIAHNLLAARNFALEQQESIIKQQNQLRIREGLAAFGAYMGSVTDWDDPKMEAGAWEVGKKHPWIMGTPAFEAGIQNFSKARLASDQIDLRKEIALVAAAARIAGMEAQMEGLKFRAETTAANAEANRDLRRDLAVFKAGVDERLLTQRGEQSLDQIEARGENAIELAREKDLLKQAGFDDLQVAEFGGTHFIRVPGGGLHQVPMFSAAEKTTHLSLIRRQEQLRKEMAALGTGKQDKAKWQSLDIDMKNLNVRQLQIEKDAVERLKKIKPTILGSAPAAEVMGPPTSAAAAPAIESQQLRYAREAVAAGVPKERVAKKYKEETGLDYPE